MGAIPGINRRVWIELEGGRLPAIMKVQLGRNRSGTRWVSCARRPGDSTSWMGRVCARLPSLVLSFQIPHDCFVSLEPHPPGEGRQGRFQLDSRKDRPRAASRLFRVTRHRRGVWIRTYPPWSSYNSSSPGLSCPIATRSASMISSSMPRSTGPTNFCRRIGSSMAGLLTCEPEECTRRSPHPRS